MKQITEIDGCPVYKDKRGRIRIKAPDWKHLRALTVEEWTQLLKPCPFGDEEPVLVECDNCTFSGPGYYIACPECQLRFGRRVNWVHETYCGCEDKAKLCHFDNPQEAVKAWNKRREKHVD